MIKRKAPGPQFTHHPSPVTHYDSRFTQIVVDTPETVLLAEKTDEIGFAKEWRVLAAIKLYELGGLSSGIRSGAC